MRIDILLYDGFDELDAIGPYEVFQMAAAEADLECRLVTAGVAELVTASHGLAIVPHGSYQSGADVLLVPGGTWVARGDVGAWAEYQRGEIPALLAQARADTPVMAGVCTGVLLLGAAGVLAKRPVATHHQARRDLVEFGSTVVAKRVVDSGDIVTCGGVTSGIDLALWLVERFFGARLAASIATTLEYQRWDGDPLDPTGVDDQVRTIE